MGTGKKMMIYPWLCVYNSMHYGDIPYNEHPDENDQESIVLPSRENQEDLVIKKDLAEKLSSEAKDVVRLILNSPSEILEMFMTEKYRTISKRKIGQYLIEKGWKQTKVDRIFSELKVFVTDFDNIQ
jgi:hypothetical protein